MKTDRPFLQVWHFQPVCLPWGFWWSSLVGSSSGDDFRTAGNATAPTATGAEYSGGSLGSGEMPEWWRFSEAEAAYAVAFSDECRGRPFRDLLRADYAALKRNAVSSLLELDWARSDFCLVVNRHGVPQLVFYLVFQATDELQCQERLNALAAAAESFRHDLFEQLIYPLVERTKWADTARRRACAQFVALAERAFGAGARETQGVQLADCLPPATAHVALATKLPGDFWKTIHTDSEAESQLANPPSLCERYRGSWAHFGWGRTSLAGLPSAESQACFHLVGFVQSSWYQLRFFRKYLLEHLEAFATAKGPAALEQWHKKLDTLVVAYEEFLSLHSDHRASQKPLLHEVFLEIERQWHMGEDLERFKRSYDTAREFTERRFRASVGEGERRREQASRKQQIALNAIAVIQILTIVCVVADYFNLNAQTSWDSMSAVWLPACLVLATAALLVYLICLLRTR